MEHVLDNPVWNALISGNKHLAYGNDMVKYFDKEVSPFVAIKEISSVNLQMLHNMLPHDSPVLMITTTKMEIPDNWNVGMYVMGLQMVCETGAEYHTEPLPITALTQEHVPQMLALTQLTNPGPFAARTIEFGHYYGVFENDQLVAMAGQRLHTSPYAEISAVCTHPDHLGKGYARQLLNYHIHRIKNADGIPFLHVRQDNERAIKIYESLGFSKRKPVHFYAISKKK